MGSSWRPLDLRTMQPRPAAPPGRLMSESKLVCVTSADFVTLTLMAPAWVLNDASRRQWGLGEGFLTGLALMPLFGPLTYLLLRPRLPEQRRDPPPDASAPTD